MRGAKVTRQKTHIYGEGTAYRERKGRSRSRDHGGKVMRDLGRAGEKRAQHFGVTLPSEQLLPNGLKCVDLYGHTSP